MLDDDLTSPSGDDIVDAARSASGDLTYKLYGSGADALDKAGLGFDDAPRHRRLGGPFDQDSRMVGGLGGIGSARRRGGIRKSSGNACPTS